MAYQTPAPASADAPGPAPDRATAARQRRDLLLLAGGALLFRLALLAYPRVMRWDEPTYLQLARSLWSGRGFTLRGLPELHHAPLFPLLLGAFDSPAHPELAGDLWYLLPGPFLVLAVYFLARRTEAHAPALLAAGLTAFAPALTSAVLVWGTMTEPLFTLLVWAAVALVAASAAGSRAPGFAAAGAVLGCAYLLRPEGVLWVGSLAAAALLAWAVQGGLKRARSWLCMALLAGCFLAVASPFLLYLRRETGRFLLSGKLGITYEIGAAVERGDPVLYDRIVSTLGPDGEIRAASGHLDRGLGGRLAARPAQAEGRLLRNLRRVLRGVASSEVFPALLLLPALWAWIGRPWDARRVAEEGFRLAGAAPVASFLLFHVQQRFFAPALPALLIWAGAGLWDAAGRLAGRRRGSGRRRSGRALVLAALVALAGAELAWGHARVLRRGLATFDYAHETVGRWLALHSPPGSRIMSRDPAIALYAGRAHVPSPRAPWRGMLAYGRRHDATHLVVDEEEVTRVRPYLRGLLDETPPGLARVATARDRQGRTLVFRFVAAPGNQPAAGPSARPD